MRNRDKSFAIIMPSIIFILLYLLLSIVFDYTTHRNHIPIKEKITSWQNEKKNTPVLVIEELESPD